MNVELLPRIRENSKTKWLLDLSLYKFVEIHEISPKYIHLGLAGAMFWDTSLDDFTGSFCGEGKYPLISMFNTCLDTGVLTTTESIKTTSVSTTTPDNPLTTTTNKPSTNGKAGIEKMITRFFYILQS